MTTIVSPPSPLFGSVLKTRSQLLPTDNPPFPSAEYTSEHDLIEARAATILDVLNPTVTITSGLGNALRFFVPFAAVALLTRGK